MKTRISGILLKAAKVCLDNMVVFDKLSDDDKKFYKLWKEYAPKNQTFAEFKKMADGDLSKMKSMAKHWVSRSEKIKKCQDLNKQIEEAQLKINDLLKKYGINNLEYLWEESSSFDNLRIKNKDLARAYALWNELNSERNRIICTSNYSTINQDFCKYDKVIDEFNNLMKRKAKQAYEKNKKEHPNIAPEHFVRTEEWRGLQEDYFYELKQLQSKYYDLEIAENFYLENLGNVVEDYASSFGLVVKNNPEIKQKLKEWKNLELEDRVLLLQSIIDVYAKTFGTPFIKVCIDSRGGSSAGDAHVPRETYLGYDYDGMIIETEIKPKVSVNIACVLKDDDFAVALHAAAHEYGHVVDMFVPNEGAVGEQFMHNSVYRRNNQTYRIEFTEQSSYKIGPAVAREITGTRNIYYGKEFDLNFAQKTHGKPDFVKKFWSLLYKYKNID